MHPSIEIRMGIPPFLCLTLIRLDNYHNRSKRFRNPSESNFRVTSIITEDLMHVIDVNSGKKVDSKKNQEDNAIAVNLEAAEEVARQLEILQGDAEYQHAFIAINLSGRHLTQIHQLNKLITLIKEQPFEPQRLILEFNETAFSQHEELSLKGLRKLKSIGVKLALDDYASGVSSFSFLHNYPFEFIKLDRGFIRTLKNSNKNLPLVKALHDLGEQYGYRLVAEGIESEGVMKKLHSVGCDFGQGYHISKPEKLQANLLTNQGKNCA